MIPSAVLFFISIVWTILGCFALPYKTEKIPSGYEIVIHGGRTYCGIDAIAWAKQCEQSGAGELCVNSIDADGTKNGYEINLTKMICEAVQIPVIASGGAGKRRGTDGSDVPRNVQSSRNYVIMKTMNEQKEKLQRLVRRLNAYKKMAQEAGRFSEEKLAGLKTAINDCETMIVELKQTMAIQNQF